MPRLPKNPEDYTNGHAERYIQRAWRMFDEYERKVDFEKMTQEEVNELYTPYRHAREEAINVAHGAEWMVAEAEALP